MIERRELSPEAQRMLDTVMEMNNLNPADLEYLCWRDYCLKDKPGILGLFVVNENWYAFTSMPVLIVPEESKMKAQEVLQLTGTIENNAGAKYVVAEPGGILYGMICAKIDPVPKEEIETLFKKLLDVLTDIRRDIMSALERVQGLADQTAKHPSPRLPIIKMTPIEADVIYRVLSHCEKQVQDIYNGLMTAWSRAGFTVTVTSRNIVLDVPRGKTFSRLAMLLPSEVIDASRNRTRPPTIVLFWDNLRKYGYFPEEAIDLYQNTVKKYAKVHITSSSAHIRMGEDFDLRSARKLSKALINLAKQIKPYEDKPMGKFNNTTPKNLKATLDACNNRTRIMFEHLIEEWEKAEGSIQCRKTGRVYLKMKTKTHHRGFFSRRPRNFNLCVLAVPKDLNSAHIEVSWGLAASEYASYLDCIPEAVARFEGIVSALPGFEQNGYLRRLKIDEHFQDEHAQVFSQAMLELKTAESKAN
jgi:hypothetical protein